MSDNEQPNKIQAAILRELLFRKTAHFADLQGKTDLTSDHFNFHIERLVALGLVEKVARGEYRLTTRGKEFANKMDTDTLTMERQPKISVLLLVTRKNDRGATEYLLQQRRKQPFFGFWGMMGGKVRWGESFETTAARELREETGLDSEFKFLAVYRKRDYNEQRELLEDKVFIRMKTVEPRGELVADFEGGHNEWLTLDQIKKLDRIYGGAANFLKIITNESDYIATEYAYDETAEY